MDWSNITEVITNQGFPIALSIFLIFRIDKFMQELISTQKEGYQQIFKQVSIVQRTLTELNQQNRDYYTLFCSEIQRELASIKARTREAS
ncbi:MAG TPA: YvrJ family protein [Atribacterota bacterium]|nr:YvrJ family protein [Atribacterota bacterium]